MSTNEVIEKKKENSKEMLLKEITLQLSTALVALKESLGNKKFEKRIKKAAKLLIEGIKSKSPKKAPVKKTTPVKKSLAKPKAAAPRKKGAKSTSIAK